MPTAKAVAVRACRGAQTMAETISALSDAGLVHREKDPDHGRQILLSNTEAGVGRSAIRTAVAPTDMGKVMPLPRP